MVATNPGPRGNTWEFEYSYTDEVGFEHMPFLCIADNQVPPNDFGYNCGGPNTFHAVGGQPISFDVNGTPESPASFDLFFTLEQLM